MLARTHDRLAIGSLADLKRAYEQELTDYGAEVDKVLEGHRETMQRITTDGIR